MLEITGLLLCWRGWLIPDVHCVSVGTQMCKKNWLSSLLLFPRKNLPTVAVSVFAGVSRWLLQLITVMKPEFSKMILLNGDRSLQHLFLYLPWWKSSYLIYSSFIAKICLLHALKLTVLLRDSIKRKKMGCARREKVVPFTSNSFPVWLQYKHKRMTLVCYCWS